MLIYVITLTVLYLIQIVGCSIQIFTGDYVVVSEPFLNKVAKILVNFIFVLWGLILIF